MNIYKETKGQGEDIVIFHGWGCDHRYMQPIVDQLSDRYQVTNVDLPGRGQSDWNPSIQTMDDIADQLLPHLPKHAIYIGWSFGGLVAMSIAARYSERVKRFIGIATTPRFVVDGKNWPGIPQPGFKASFNLGIKQRGFKRFLQDWFDSEFVDLNPKPAVYNELIDMLNKDSVRIDLDILFKGIDICDATDLREEFKSIKCPIDLILSEKDDTVPRIAFEKMKALNSNINIHIISNGRHMAFWTHQAEFNKILKPIV